MSKIIWQWDTGVRGVSSPQKFELSINQAIKADSLVEELWRWADKNGFDEAEVRNEIRDLEAELKRLKNMHLNYTLKAGQIEKITRADFPGLFPAGPSLGGLDEEGNYYQVIDGEIERG